jgi:hypothetical protein
MDWKADLDNAFSDLWSKRNLRLLALFWGAGLFLVISYGTSTGRFDGAARPATVAASTPRENETGTFSTWRPEIADRSRPSYRVVFDNLAAQDRSLGLFRTASHKVINIRNLHVTFRSAGMLAADGGVRLRDFCDLFRPRKATRGGTCALGVLDGLEAGQGDWSLGVDLANATEVRINDLDWRVCRGDAMVLRVQCHFASLRAKGSRIVLRGHATVTTPEAVLESNCIEMDVREESFVVDGRYLLTRGQRQERGNRGRFDATLRMLEVVSSDTGENGAWADGSQYGRF